MFIRAQFKQTARARLRQSPLGGFAAGILLLAVIWPLARAVTNSGFNLWLLLALGLIMGPLLLAAAGFYLTLYRENQGDIRCFFAGLNQCWRGAAAMLWQMLWVTLWSLLLVIPGIVKLCAYSMQFFLLQDNPALSVRESLNLSQKLTCGFKWELFNMALSFIGWFCLGALTMGIGYLWLLPYWQASFCGVYCFLKEDALKNNRVTKAELGIKEETAALSADEWDNEKVPDLPPESSAASEAAGENEAILSDWELSRQAAIIAKASLHFDKGASK